MLLGFFHVAMVGILVINDAYIVFVSRGYLYCVIGGLASRFCGDRKRNYKTWKFAYNPHKIYCTPSP